MSITASSSTSVSYPTGPTALTTLATASSTAAQLSNEREISIINQQIQNQLAAKIATLEAPPDAAVTQALGSQISALQTQHSAVIALSPQYGANSNVLVDLQTQLAGLQTAAAAGDSATFDSTLTAAKTDLSDLTPVTAPAPFQPDQIAPLLSSGLGIASSSSYDLSTPAGQAAAAQDITNAQNLVGVIANLTTGNQLLSTDMATSLQTQIDNLTTQQQNLEQSSAAQTTTEVAQLTQQASDQAHLIELALGNTATVATALAAAMNPPQLPTSVFQVLSNAVGATPTSNAQNPPAILSLLT